MHMGSGRTHEGEGDDGLQTSHGGRLGSWELVDWPEVER